MSTGTKVIAIGGITASGKTSLSLKLAKKYDGDIISCDSRQVYRGLDIGTAKEPITKKYPDGSVDIDGVRHYLIDTVKPSTPYSLADFQKDARRAVDTIAAKGTIPFLVGGTGLYIDAVLYNYELIDERDHTTLRKSLNELSVEELQSKLEESAPEILESLNDSDRKNPRRLIRAIEKSAENNVQDTEAKKNPEYNFLYLALDTPDTILEERICERIEQMFADGLLEENMRLREMHLNPESPALSSIGYKEFENYFAGSQTIEETKNLIAIHTRQYAKRQRTWFKKNPDVRWIQNEDDAEKQVQRFISVA